MMEQSSRYGSNEQTFIACVWPAIGMGGLGLVAARVGLLEASVWLQKMMLIAFSRLRHGSRNAGSGDLIDGASLAFPSPVIAALCMHVTL